MKTKTTQQASIETAVEAVKGLESATGVKVKSGLRAGAGGGGGKGGQYQPLYGTPTGTEA